MRWLFLLVLVSLSSCATIPPESVRLSQQVEKNLGTLKANNLAVLKAWREVAIDYWTEKVAREGPDIILKKAKDAGKPVDLTKDYRDLVARVLDQYKANFLNKIDEVFIKARDKISADFDMTEEAARSLTALLQSAVRLEQEQQKAMQGALNALGLDDSIQNAQNELKKSLSGP